MPRIGLGDMSQHFQTLRQTTQIKERLARLGQELSTGHVSDLAAHLRGAAPVLADSDRRLAIASRQADAARQFGQQLDSIEVGLSAIETTRAALAADLIPIGPDSQVSTMTAAAATARAAFADTVATLNLRHGAESMFSGTATDGAALAPADDILAAIEAAVAGATDIADLKSRLDTFFDTPGGGFMTAAYLGDTGALATRDIGDGTPLDRPARADDAGLRTVLKAAALGAMANSTGIAFSDRDRGQMLRDAGTDLQSAAEPLTALRARTGQAAERADRAAARHAGEVAALSILHNEMTAADPYATATALQETETQLQTQFTLIARLSNLSLVGFLR